MSNAQPHTAKKVLFWIAILYVAQGLPYGVYAEILPVYLRTQGVDLRQIGWLSLIGLAWTLKFLWAPLVENIGRPQAWIGAMLAVFAMVNAVVAIFPAHQTEWTFLLLAIIAIMALASATNDIAIDGYSIRLLEGKNIGKANGVRVAAYRVGLLICGALLLLTRWWDWSWVFFGASGILLVFALLSWFSPRLPESSLPDAGQPFWKVFKQRFYDHPTLFFGVTLTLSLFVLWIVDGVPRKAPFIRVADWFSFLPLPKDLSIWFWLWTLWLISAGIMFLHRRKSKKKEPHSTSLKEGGVMAMIARPYMPMVLLFILLFKLADSSMGFMVKPFWVDSGFSPEEIGLVSINIGIGLSIAGSIVGGWYTDKVGVYKSLWVMGLWQIASNGVYALSAWLLPSLAGDTLFGIIASKQALIYSASAFESFTGGLGTASFLALLMTLVNARYATTEYAVLSALFAASRSLAGFFSGYGAHFLGYAPYFALTMLLGLPAFLLLPWVKKALNQMVKNN